MRSKGNRTYKSHKKVLKQTKGFRYSYHKLYRRAHEALMHAGMYSYKHRRKRLGEFKKLWIQRINIALKNLGYKYSRFFFNLKQKNVELNRKMLSEIAVHKPKVFEKIVKFAFGKDNA